MRQDVAALEQASNEQIRALLAQGLGSEEVASQLGVAKGRVAAVRAHMTMGTYDQGHRRTSGGIYLRRDGELIAMTERPYATEDALQALLAEHPGLLAGDQFGDAPRRWVLLSREVAVADADSAAGRWSVDHLFVDQDAIPTLVEVKRSSDTRIRREVVGQLLEYAANGTRYWPVEQLRALFEAGCRQRGAEPALVLEQSFGEDLDVDAWWADVGENLARGRLRLVFVADVIGRELRRIIEFLNEQMTQTEVLGVEIRQYVDDRGEHQTIVPRLIGQTERARTTKSPGRSGTGDWDEQALLAALTERAGAEQAGVAGRLLAWAAERQYVRVDYGKGAKDGSAQFRLDDGGATLHAFNVWTYGMIEIPFDFMAYNKQAPFADDRSARDELRRLINEAAPLARVPPEEQRKRPSFPLKAVADEPALRGFTAAIGWAFDQARAAQARSLGQ